MRNHAVQLTLPLLISANKSLARTRAKSRKKARTKLFKGQDLEEEVKVQLRTEGLYKEGAKEVKL